MGTDLTGHGERFARDIRNQCHFAVSATSVGTFSTSNARTRISTRKSGARDEALQQARQIGIQQLPQIRIVQSGDETLIENLQATTELTIPVWKQKMILLLGLSRQQSALALQKTVTDATNQMMRQASEMMKTQA